MYGIFEREGERRGETEKERHKKVGGGAGERKRIANKIGRGGGAGERKKKGNITRVWRSIEKR